MSEREEALQVGALLTLYGIVGGIGGYWLALWFGTWLTA
jgi:hypothetical protein